MSDENRHTFTRKDGSTHTLVSLWYSQSGNVWCCASCGIEDHTGDLKWDEHTCLVRASKRTNCNNPF